MCHTAIYQDQGKAAKLYAAEVIQIQNDKAMMHQMSVDMIENPVHVDNDDVTAGLKDPRPDEFAKIEKRKNTRI